MDFSPFIWSWMNYLDFLILTIFLWVLVPGVTVSAVGIAWKFCADSAFWRDFNSQASSLFCCSGEGSGSEWDPSICP